MSQAANPYAAPAANLAPGHKHCDSCGADILIKAEICPKCGVRQHKPVSKAALLLLTFFFGGLGAHKFYLGKNWQGVVYLLLFLIVSPIPILIALIEFIIYAFTSSESLNEKYSAAGSAGVVAIVAIVGVFVLVAIIGILAAIAIPAYQDYTVRAKVMGAIATTSPLQRSVETYYLANQKLPAAPADLGPGASEAGDAFSRSSVGENGVVTITLAPSAGSQVAGNTIVFQPRVDGGMLRWDCTAGTLMPRHRPQACRAPR